MASGASFMVDDPTSRSPRRSLLLAGLGLRRLDGVLAELPERRREVLLLVFLDPLLFERVAEVDEHRLPLLLLQLRLRPEDLLHEPAFILAVRARLGPARLDANEVDEILLDLLELRSFDPAQLLVELRIGSRVLHE